MKLAGGKAAIALLCLLFVKCGSAVRYYSRRYVGCYSDTVASRDLTALANVTSMQGYSVHQTAHAVIVGSMTLELCANVCSLGGFPYMGIQMAQECYCGWSYGRNGLAAAGACYLGCGGNASQNCGGANANSVYGLKYTYTDLFKTSSRDSISVLSGFSAYRSITSDLAIRCLEQCGSDCQAVIFNPQQQLCSLLKFALVPTELSGIGGDFFVRF